MLSNDLTVQYDLMVNKIQYNRSSYLLETTTGQCFLRKVLIPTNQIIFEYEVNKQILDKGFTEIEKIHLTKKKTPYAVQQDRVYILQSYEEMEDIDFHLEEDLKNIVAVLARFHNAAQDIRVVGRKIDKTRIKNIQGYFKKRTIETKKMKNTLQKIAQKSPFEILFMEGYKEYEELEYMALDLITEEASMRLIEKAYSNRTISHNEYTYHAIEKSKEGIYIIKNLDTCGYNVQLLDLGKLLVKIMQKNNWDIVMLEKLIGEYVKIKSLTDEELQVLKSLLIFPEKFASICHKYYTSKHRNHYSMFGVKWENMLAYKDDQIKTARDIQKYL
ncbi:MAG: hypothetical protein ACRCSG_03565 [Cellulosilyticaceae bacterium]